MKNLKGMRNPSPLIQISLNNIRGEKILNKVKAPIKTGYEGFIMLTSDFYNNFLSSELLRRLWRSYRILTG